MIEGEGGGPLPFQDGLSQEQYLKVLEHRLWFLHYHGLSLLGSPGRSAVAAVSEALDGLRPYRPHYVRAPW